MNKFKISAKFSSVTNFAKVALHGVAHALWQRTSSWSAPGRDSLITAIALTAVLSGCAITGKGPESTIIMDEDTRGHPATEQFLRFADAAKTTNNANDLKDQFYTPFAAEQLVAQKGWYRLAYSSNHYILKGMDCEKLQMTRSRHKTVQFDCTGVYNAWSPILGDTVERAHLRAHMKEINGVWLFERSGYVHTQTFEDVVSKRRGGLKFSGEDLNPLP